ncbi:hypothetical protein CPter91_1364 [Collimonas pratensis]|uniref:Uncharacterized protein n=1 Tax=Collimonas pratensis TaxID=279113 RepID=A0A127Q1N5_9BURK|nr:hypothetical protein CPter91_1364 [Collimonas pratensis]
MMDMTQNSSSHWMAIYDLASRSETTSKLSPKAPTATAAMRLLMRLARE